MSSTSFVIPARPREQAAARVWRWARARPALTVAGVVLALSFAALLAIHQPARLAVSKPAAIAYVRADRAIYRAVARLHYTSWDVSPTDNRDELVEFFRGPKLIATVGIGPGSPVSVGPMTDSSRQGYDFGSSTANALPVLGLLGLVFVLMAAVSPLWRIRNLDVLAVASLTFSVILLNEGLLGRVVLVSYPALAYLAFRCAWVALGRAGPSAGSVPLFDWLTRGWSPSQRVRTLRLTAGACVLVVTMVGLSSPLLLDAAYAVMEGATGILHGVLPYGHISDVFHGDTYPIGSYLLYVPFAWLTPVHDMWADASLTLVVAVAAALLVAVCLARGATQRADRAGAGRGDGAGLRAAIVWLTFPPLLVTVSTGTTDVALAAMLTVAFLLWRRPGASTAALSAAAWFKVTGIVLLPLWLARLRGRALATALGAITVTSAAMLAVLIGMGGIDAPAHMLSAMSYQFTRSSPRTLWTMMGSVPLQQLAQAATVALLVGGVVRIRRDPDMARDRARMAALCAAIILGLLISANYWNYMYLVWFLPLFGLSLLAP